MSRTRWISVAACCSAALALICGWQGSWGQTAKKAAAVSPEQIFSAETVAYLRHDGTKAHQADWEKTAAYKALIKSGLAASIDKWLTSLGQQQPQAETGRKLLWHMLEQGFSLGVIPPSDPNSADVTVTFVLHNGADLAAELEALHPGQSVAAEYSANGFTRSYKAIELPDLEFKLAFWTEGTHLVLVVCPGEPTATLKTLSKETADITTLPEWDRRNSLDEGQVLTGVAWVDLKRLIEIYAGLVIPETPGEQPVELGTVLTMLGLDNVTELVGRQGYDGKVCVSRVDLLHDGPREGLLKLLGGLPMTLRNLPPLPEYSTSIVGASMDSVEVYDAVLSVVLELNDKLSPETAPEVREAVASWDDFVGGSVRNDVVANLGPVQSFFNDPTNGIAGFGYGYAIEVKNPETIRRILNDLLALIPDEGDQGVRVIRNEKEGRELISVGTPGIPFFPTFCVDEEWLIVGMTSQTVESFFARKAGELDPWQPTKEQQELLDKLPQEFVSLQLTDPRETLRMINQYLPFIQGAMASSPDAPGMPMFELPSVERIVKPMFPTAAVTTVDDAGMHYQSRQALPGIPMFGSADSISIGTASIGVALLLPAVQQSREAARRTQSKNNLKQIMLALHNYHDVNNMFPAGIIEGQDEPEDSLSWYALMLPYLDQEQLYRKLDRDRAWDHEANKELAETLVGVFRNPSATDAELNGPAQSDYAGVAGLGKDGPKKKVGDEGAGIFAYDRATRIQDITDGTSNTLMVGDVSKDRGAWLQGGKSTIRPFVAKPYINGPDGWGGNHVGGANFGLADGSVRFISENIAPEVMEALTTIQGGEQIGDF